MESAEHTLMQVSSNSVVSTVRKGGFHSGVSFEEIVQRRGEFVGGDEHGGAQGLGRLRAEESR